MGEIKVTYNTLFELLRRERTRHELQKLDPDFYKDVVNYLKEKSKVQSSSDVIMVHEETTRQLENAKKLVKNLYEKREKKIIQLAIDASTHVGVNGMKTIVDTSALLENEKKFFDELMILLEKHRTGVLLNVLLSKEPKLEKEEAVRSPENEKNTKGEAKRARDTKLLRFLQPVPQFMGPELEVYGPFDKEDIASLPEKVAEILVSKERAEYIEG